MLRNNMKKIFLVIFTCLGFCSININAQVATNLNAASFNTKLNQTNSAQIVDVRTSREFEQGFIQNALNIDIGRNDFTDKISKLDKNRPVFVYCLSGSRSSHAMSYMRSVGFKEVYNLSGGIIRWRTANLPETTARAASASSASSRGMTMAQYRSLTNSNKLVLVSFSADWCAPCQRMKPFIDQISREYKDRIVVVRIDVDANKALMQELKIQSIPVLSIYKNKNRVWTHNGFISKDDLIRKITSL